MTTLISDWSDTVQIEVVATSSPEIEIQKITPNIRNNYDYFGTSVSLSETGNVLFVGSPYADDPGYWIDGGKFYSYRRHDGVYQLDAIMSANDVAAGDLFGNSVAISFDESTAIVGAPGKTYGPAAGAGAVYVYKNNTWWGEWSKLISPNYAENNNFGCSVASNINGTTVIVGESGFNGHGRAIVYALNNEGEISTVWPLQPNVSAGAAAGHSCDISTSGEVAVFGVPFEQQAGGYQGKVFIYRNTEGVNGTWTLEAELVPSDNHNHGRYGSSVSLSGDGTHLFVSAPYGDDAGTGSGYGSVYVYQYVGGSWTFTTKITAPDAAIGDYFGWSVDSNSNATLLVVGSSWDDDKGSGSGSAYVFRRTGSTWALETKLTASDGQANDYFGDSVAISGTGEVAVISSERNDEAGVDTGAVYIYA